MLPSEMDADGPPGSSLAKGRSPEDAPTDGLPRWHSRGYLPHFDSSTAFQHVTFRLADSLPKQVAWRLSSEINQLRLESRERERRARMEAWMDAGYGSCVLREPEIAGMVQTALLHGDNMRYRLLAWVVMPNHVHALIRTLGEWTVGRIVGSWKSYTGRRISEWRKKARLEPGGPGGASLVWHREYWDRFARNEAHVLHFRDYIHENPVKAGLVRRAEDWRWSSAHWLRSGPRDVEQKSS